MHKSSSRMVRYTNTPPAEDMNQKSYKCKGQYLILRQDTDHRLREALLSFMEQDREPTVGELCERAQINRSTFYRHYLDVYDLMEKIETQIQKGLAQVLTEGEPEHLERLARYVSEYRHFYRIYLKKNMDGSMENGFQTIWETRLKPRFLAAGSRTSVGCCTTSTMSAPG